MSCKAPTNCRLRTVELEASISKKDAQLTLFCYRGDLFRAKAKSQSERNAQLEPALAQMIEVVKIKDEQVSTLEDLADKHSEKIEEAINDQIAFAGERTQFEKDLAQAAVDKGEVVKWKKEAEGHQKWRTDNAALKQELLDLKNVRAENLRLKKG